MTTSLFSIFIYVIIKYLTLPEFFKVKPAKILIKVDFPAPFKPNNPNNDFSGIFKLTFFRAETSWFFFVLKILFKLFISTAYLIFLSLIIKL